jgi:Uma2 family endonuclease
MSMLTLELRPREEQTAFNLRRWDEVLADTALRKVAGRVETDRHGRITMSPPPAPRHGELQNRIGSLLEDLMPPGHTVTECPVSTADGVKGVDVAWASPEHWGDLGNRACFIRLPEICVEVMSPSNSEEEIREKMALYFDAGAKEVWICGIFGAMAFYRPVGVALARSELCPDFPTQI